jgi:cobaltochelatase CobT
VVLSDGAPVDDATLSANHAHYLDQHLRQVIRQLEHTRGLRLRALGIGHDVTRYYRHAITLRDVETLGSVLLTAFSSLLHEGHGAP